MPNSNNCYCVIASIYIQKQEIIISVVVKSKIINKTKKRTPRKIQKRKHIKPRDNNCHISDLVQAFSYKTMVD